MTPPTPTASSPAIYCRHCGYDLRASTARGISLMAPGKLYTSSSGMIPNNAANGDIPR